MAARSAYADSQCDCDENRISFVFWKFHSNTIISRATSMFHIHHPITIVTTTPAWFRAGTARNRGGCAIKRVRSIASKEERGSLFFGKNGACAAAIFFFILILPHVHHRGYALSNDGLVATWAQTYVLQTFLHCLHTCGAWSVDAFKVERKGETSVSVNLGMWLFLCPHKNKRLQENTP